MCPLVTILFTSLAEDELIHKLFLIRNRENKLSFRSKNCGKLVSHEFLSDLVLFISIQYSLLTFPLISKQA